MSELNKEQIKKALECCTLGDCYPCPYGNIGAGCRDKMCEDALALINSQEQRIKELTEENDKLYRLLDDKIQENKKLTEENEMLREACDRSDLLCKVTAEISKTTRNEVIDEFAEMVKEKMREVATGKRTSLVGIGWLDQIVKELKGE